MRNMRYGKGTDWTYRKPDFQNISWLMGRLRIHPLERIQVLVVLILFLGINRCLLLLRI
jgi:hypothetical protein